MADEVKLYGVGGSPYVCRVKIALNLKQVKYQNIEEDLSNKSADLIKYNPVHQKVPVLVHNGNPVTESSLNTSMMPGKEFRFCLRILMRGLLLDFGQNSSMISAFLQLSRFSAAKERSKLLQKLMSNWHC